MCRSFFRFIGNSFSYKAKNAPQGCDLCGVEDALACPHGRAKSHIVTLCSPFVSNDSCDRVP